MDALAPWTDSVDVAELWSVRHDALDVSILTTSAGVVTQVRPGVVPDGLERADPELVFYLSDEERTRLRQEADEPGVRGLTPAAAEAFAAFHAACPADDRDEAFVELDHWAGVGAFAGDDLLAVATAYPWRGTRVADIGVLTRPEVRGRGLARAVVRALGREILRRDHEPQYRCGADNLASGAVARSAGFVLMAVWEYVVAPGEDP